MVKIKKSNKTETPVGTLRIGAKDLKIYEKTKSGWKKSNKELPDTIKVIHLFKSNQNIKALIDNKNPKFLKGQLSKDGKAFGARINILPNGKVLDKAYSLFAKHLTIHDESSHDHWDVIFQNPGGKYAYLYTLEKKKSSVKNKYRKVEEFAKSYPTLYKNVLKNLRNKDDRLALPMFTLLKTYMRVGNELYYNANGHKGLTTLKKSDIKITSPDKVRFSYIAKSGVPQIIEEKFPKEYVSRLSYYIKNLKNSDFIFTNEEGHPLKDTNFMHAFEIYCGKRFYPHIVRSYYATSKAEQFLAEKKNPSKKEVHELFTSIAEKLGHKNFSKKDNIWKDNYNVTIHHYLNPQILDKINSSIK